MKEPEIKITECPRDAMQGITEFIPTEQKIEYLNLLLNANFSRLDFGSFVSPKAIPQMADTAEVLESLDLGVSSTSLLAIVANERGAKEALSFEEIEYLGYPLSLSDTFQIRNTNRNLTEALSDLTEINFMVKRKKRNLVVYLSMGFGNPYGDKWSADIVGRMSKHLIDMGIRDIALSDTIGIATPELIDQLFASLTDKHPDVNFIAHLHSTPETALSKIEAAYNAGCRSFDSAVKGFGGCPLAVDKLTGNIATETLLQFAEDKKLYTAINEDAFGEAYDFASQVFKHA